MKPMRILISINVIFMISLSCTLVHAQDPAPDHKPQPDVKWEVRKEYDEHGNLIYYDSSCSHTWKHFNFPGPGIEHAFEDVDSSFFNKPYGFIHFKDFSDSAWMDSFSPDSLFPDAYMPFDDPHEFFERHRERMERFREEFPFPGDSLHQFHPKWQQLPQNQKNPARVIEI